MQDFEREMQGITAPTLTLGPEPALGGNTIVEEGTSAGTVNESMLTDSEKEMVDQFVNQIDISDLRMVNSYGAAAQNNITSFSKSITSTVKTKDLDDAVGNSLRDLRSAISSSVAPEKKGVFGLFQKGKQKAAYFISNYESAETNIQKIEKDLQNHRQVLIKDVYLYEEMYKENLKFYKELTMYIIAGKKALANAKNTRMPELEKKAEVSQDQMDIQEYNDYRDACVRFDKRIADLETTRLVSIQMAPQIRLLQNGDQELADRIRSSILNTIPLWRNQMVLTLGISHTAKALEAQSAITDMTNELLRKNAETLKMGAINTAVASERGIIDVETLRQVNADIITSINEVVKVHEEGSRKRAAAQLEMTKIEGELKEALLKAGQR